MKKPTIYAALALFAVAAAGNAQTVVEEIVARVNNEVISRSELARSREQLAAELEQQHGSLAPQKLAEREKDLLRDLIDQQLLIQRGKDLGFTADTEVIKRLDDIRKQMKLESMEDLEKAAAQQGVSFEDFKQNLRNGIITQQVIGREVGSKIHISQAEVQEYYEKHKDQLARPEQVRLSEILIATEKPTTGPDGKPGEPVPLSEPEIVAAEAKIKQLQAQISAGADFAELAKKESQGPTAEQGGDLGFFRKGQLSADYDRVFVLKPGDVTDVMRTRQGFILLKVTEKQGGGVPPVKEVEREIQERVYLERLQPALRAYLTKLREEAYITVKQGFVDTGASPNQTQPIVTAANTDKQDEKKKRKRFLIF